MSTNRLPRCAKCGYALVRGLCPMCEGREPGDRLDAPFLPASIRSQPVTREQFITPQHFQAWRSGKPLRRHLERRKKFTREEREIFFRHHPYVCGEPGCGSTTLLTLDHIVPQIFGGSSCDCNLRPLCQKHNREAFAVFRAVLKECDRRSQRESAA